MSLSIKAPLGIIRHLSSCYLMAPSSSTEDVFALCFSKAGSFPKQFSVMTTQAHFNVFANEFPWYWKVIPFFFCNISSPFPQRNSLFFFFFCLKLQKVHTSEAIEVVLIHKTMKHHYYRPFSEPAGISGIMLGKFVHDSAVQDFHHLSGVN